MKSQKKIKHAKPFNLEHEVRGLGVMMESMGDQIKLVAEQHGEIIKTLHAHTQLIAAIQEDIRMIQVDIAITKNDIEFIKHDLRKKADTNEFSALERRVTLLERKR